jgi:hypothetical protein
MIDPQITVFPLRMQHGQVKCHSRGSKPFSALSNHNPFAHALLYLAGVDPALCITAHIRLDSTGSGSEIAAIMDYDNTTLSDVNTRKSIIVQHNGNYQSISAISRLWEPLVYSLFFPHGTLGWEVVGSHSDVANKSCFTELEFFMNHASGYLAN